MSGLLFIFFFNPETACNSLKGLSCLRASSKKLNKGFLSLTASARGSFGIVTQISWQPFRSGLSYFQDAAVAHQSRDFLVVSYPSADQV